MIIVSPICGRDGYVRIMLATLKEAMRDHDDVNIKLYDNSHTKIYLDIYRDMGDNLKVRYIDKRPNTVSHACHFIYIDMLDDIFRLLPNEDYVVNVDSDCCIHPDFVKVVKQAVSDLPRIGHISLYSEGNHPEPTSVFKGYHIRSHISMTASIVGRKAWETFPKPQSHEEMRAFWSNHISAKEHAGGIDGAFSSWCNEQGYGCYSTIRSYVEHIGAVGQYAAMNEDGASNAHRARRFLP